MSDFSHGNLCTVRIAVFGKDLVIIMDNQHIIVGTAGHVDHGKTTLTIALTGIDTDRLQEEKRRGMTIVPGFVPLDLKNGRRLALIDVPGHEKFVKNMLAGVAGIDMAILVIAADEGVMPQTEEHLNILHLLGISKGIVVITKCDLVDDNEWLELVRQQTVDLLAKTSLVNAPIIEVSAKTGQNIDALLTLLDTVAETVQPRVSTGLCRIPVDRTFTKQGFGTIATGTLWSGCIDIGSYLQLMPTGDLLRVRGLQVHDRPVSTAFSGQRTAINLSGNGIDNIKPGCWLAKPELLRESYRLDIELDLLSSVKKLAHRARVRAFHGTTEVIGRLRLLDRNFLEPGQSCLCQLELETPLFPLRHDRIILRSYSPMVTIAGATVLDAAPIRYKLNSPETMETIRKKDGLDCGEIILEILNDKRTLLTLDNISKNVQLPIKETETAIFVLVDAGMVLSKVIDGAVHFYSASMNVQWKINMLEYLETYHKKYPLRRGIASAELRQKIFTSLSVKQFSTILAEYAQEEIISIADSVVFKTGINSVLTQKQSDDLMAIEMLYRKKQLTPPDWEDVMESMQIPGADAAEYATWLFENKRLTRVADVIFASVTVKEVETILRSKHDIFTMAEARDEFNSSRRYIQPLLEYFDAQNITVREGNYRRFL